MAELVADLAFQNSAEPEWLEQPVVGNLRIWQIIFLCLAGVIALVVMVCCCIRFRIPRTKQQIEADYQRRKITAKFRQQLETIEDAKVDTMSLKGDLHVVCTQALELLLHEKISLIMDKNVQKDAQQCPVSTEPDAEAPFSQEGGQKPEPQVAGINFVKFATKVAHLTKLSQPKSPTSPTPTAPGNESLRF